MGSIDFCLIVGVGHAIFEVPVAGSQLLLLLAAVFFIPSIVSLGLVISGIMIKGIGFQAPMVEFNGLLVFTAAFVAARVFRFKKTRA